MSKDIFISHAWAEDNLKRNNHTRCKTLCDNLKKVGYSVWFDHYDMNDSIDKCIIKNIESCKIFIACLTEKYCDKINRGIIDKKINDNCFKEWNYALFKNKIIIPVLMEPKMMEIISTGQGPIQMYLNTLMYFDITTDNYEENDFKLLCRMFRKYSVYNDYENKLKQLKENTSINSFIDYINENFTRVKKPLKKLSAKGVRNIIRI